MNDVNMPPHNLDAELAFVGSMIKDRRLLDDFPDITPDHFYDQRNGTLLTAVREMTSDGVLPDEITLVEHLRANGKLEEVTEDRVFDAMGAVPYTAHTRYYANLIRKAYRRRQLLQLGREIQKRAYDDTVDPETILTLIARQTEGIDSAGPIDNSEKTLAECVELADQPEEDCEKFSAAIPSLRQKLKRGGFTAGQLVIIGARPSVGKTVLGCQILFENAKLGRLATLFTMEMGHMEMGDRAAAYGLPTAAQNRIKVVTECDITKITSRIRRNHRDGHRLFFVDYLQLATGVDGKNGRERQVAEASRMLKALTTELGVCIIVASQLNRACEAGDRRPVESDLRESGSIEQDANVTILIHRNEAGDGPPVHELIVAKQRNGERGGIVRTELDGESYTFRESHAFDHEFSG